MMSIIVHWCVRWLTLSGHWKMPDVPCHSNGCPPMLTFLVTNERMPWLRPLISTKERLSLFSSSRRPDGCYTRRYLLDIRTQVQHSTGTVTQVSLRELLQLLCQGNLSELTCHVASPSCLTFVPSPYTSCSLPSRRCEC